jgi:hypothetical protein
LTLFLILPLCKDGTATARLFAQPVQIPTGTAEYVIDTNSPETQFRFSIRVIEQGGN